MRHLLRGCARTLCLATFGCSALTEAAPLPPGWQFRVPTATAVERQLPAALQGEVLIKEGYPVPEVQIVVDLPFEQTVAQVAATLHRLGPLIERSERQPLAQLDDDWGDVLLTRRPDLRQALIDHAERPRLEQAVRDGALAASEIPERLARFQQTLRFRSGSPELAALTQPYQRWVGSVQRSDGDSSSNLVARVTQLDAVFGHPASLVSLTRVDEFPAPKGSLGKRLRSAIDIFEPSGPSRLRRQGVPQAAFASLYAALGELPDANVQLASEASHWRAPSAPSTLVKEPRLTLADTQPTVYQAKAMLTLRNLSDFIVMADDSLVLVGDYPQRLLHWSLDMGPQPQVLWSPAKAFDKGRLSRDPAGQLAYLPNEGLVTRFALNSRTLTHHPVMFDAGEPADFKYIDYLPDGQGVPLAYRHTVSGKRNSLELWQPRVQPLEDGRPWTYTRSFSAPRQSMMDGHVNGNGQIKPIRWDGPQANLWVEDVQGLAELDGRSGRVLRAIKLPRRLGKVDPRDDSGMSTHAPAPFGSLKGGWIAVGFDLQDGARSNVGLHVVDVASGQVRYSLALAGEQTLHTAVGSPDGRLLAMASAGPGAAVVVWNLKNGRSYRLPADQAGCNSVGQLQWSPSGKYLWGSCAIGVLGWSVSKQW